MQSSSQPEAAISPAPEPPSFAGFLSALASPAAAPHASAWNEEPLADDVVTLSYENALKAHSRYKPADDLLPRPGPLAASDPDAKAQSVSSRQELSPRDVAPALNQSPAAPDDLKTASITIRMSHSECAQLRQRAAEAGITVSAYLRSCTFEAETLRGQVKEALAQLRAAATSDAAPAAPSVKVRKKPDWWSRFLPRHRLHTAQGVLS
jgi:predicted DNA binding CopG/RHH family protein